MSRMDSLERELKVQLAQKRRHTAAEGGMTEDDLYMRAGKLAQMFCTGFAFLVPSLLLWQLVF